MWVCRVMLRSTSWSVASTPATPSGLRLRPVLLMSVAQTVNSEGKPMRHALHDVGMAEMSLIIQATALDLYAHPMAGFSLERARAAFALPEGYEPVVMLAVGYLGAPSLLNERRRSQELEPRTRKPLREFVFGPAWGEVVALVE
jgi:nitroreductase